MFTVNWVSDYVLLPPNHHLPPNIHTHTSTESNILSPPVKLYLQGNDCSSLFMSKHLKLSGFYLQKILSIPITNCQSSEVAEWRVGVESVGHKATSSFWREQEQSCCFFFKLILAAKDAEAVWPLESVSVNLFPCVCIFTCDISPDMSKKPTTTKTPSWCIPTQVRTMENKPLSSSLLRRSKPRRSKCGSWHGATGSHGRHLQTLSKITSAEKKASQKNASVSFG